MATDLLEPKTKKPRDLLASKSASEKNGERMPLLGQGLGKFTEGIAGIPGLPLDIGAALGNFAKRQFDMPEVPLNETGAKDWGSEGWSDFVFNNLGGTKVDAPVNEAERVVQKAGTFFGGAVPFGPAGLIPTAGAVGGSEVGRVADQAAPESTGGYGESVGALAGGLAPSALRRSAVPRTTPEQAVLAQNLMHEGVPVYPGQLATNPMTRNAYDMANKLSLYDNGAQARQGDALTRVMARTMGEDETNLVAASGQAHNRLSGTPDPRNPVGPKLAPGEYDRIYARIGDHAVDGRAMFEVTTLARRAQQLTDRSRDTVMNAVQNIASAVRNGRITVRGYKDLTDQGGALSELANSANPTLALYGNQLRQILENNIRRQAGPQDAAALATADRQWRHLKTLEPTIARSANAEGQISPALVQNAVATGSGGASARGASGMPELDTVARAGKSFLKNPITSGTAERSAILNLLTSGGPGAAVGALVGGPVGAAVGAGAGVALPLAARHVLQRQWLTRLMVNDALRRGANPNTIRRMLERMAPATPGAVQQQPPSRQIANQRLLQLRQDAQSRDLLAR